MKTCKKCVMDQSAVEITFNGYGACNFCQEYEKQKKGLGGDFEQMKNKLKQGCILGLSGGVDSSLVAYYLYIWGIRPFVICVDNGWDTEEAKENVKNILQKTGWDNIAYNLERNEFRDLQFSFLRASVRNIEIPTDHAITALKYKTANAYGLKYIADGGNIVTEAIMPESWGYYAQDLKYIKGIHKKFGQVQLNNFPQMDLKKWFYYIFIKRIKTISVLDYVDYNRDKAKETLKKVFGWQDYGEKHWESTFTKWFQTYYLPIKFNIDKRKAHYSTLINSGQMTREEALKRLKQKPFYLDELISIFNNLKVSKNVLDKIMRLPHKTYRDYPNNSWIFKENSPLRSLIRKIYRTFVKA